MDASTQTIILSVVTAVLSFLAKDLFTYLVNKRKSGTETYGMEIDNEAKEASLSAQYLSLANASAVESIKIREKFDALVKQMEINEDENRIALSRNAAGYECEIREIRGIVATLTIRLEASEIYGKKWFEYSSRLIMQLKSHDIIPAPFDTSVYVGALTRRSTDASIVTEEEE